MELNQYLVTMNNTFFILIIGYNRFLMSRICCLFLYWPLGGVSFRRVL